MSAGLAACTTDKTTGPTIPYGYKGSRAITSVSSSDKKCNTTGGVTTGQFSGQIVSNKNSSKSTVNNWKSTYEKFTSNISSDKSSTNEVNISTEQKIIIENNIDITLNLTMEIGMIRDSTLTYTGVNVTNNFSFGLKTGDTSLGTRVIQDAAQTSTTKSKQDIKSKSTLGYSATTKQKADTWAKLISTMKVSFGPNGMFVFFIIILFPFVFYGVWKLFCIQQSLCPSILCKYMRKDLNSIKELGNRETVFNNQLLSCVDDSMLSSLQKSGKSLVKNYSEWCKDEKTCIDDVKEYLEKQMDNASGNSKKKWESLVSSWNNVVERIGKVY
jgi:hypothetical protein